jgi:hypothetical protein
LSDSKQSLDRSEICSIIGTVESRFTTRRFPGNYRRMPTVIGSLRILGFHLIFSICVLLLVLDGDAYSATDQSKNTPKLFPFSSVGFKDILANEQTDIELKKTSMGFVWAAENHLVSLDIFRVFRFTPSSAGTYSIKYQCDEVYLALIAIDAKGKIIDTSRSVNEPPETLTKSISLLAGQSIWLVIGTSEVPRPIICRLGLFGDSGALLNISKGQNYNSLRHGQGTKSFNFDLVDGNKAYRPIMFFKPTAANTGVWTTIVAESTEIAPYTLVLDGNGNPIPGLSRKETRRASEVLISPEVKWSAFAVQAYEVPAKAGSGRFSISFDETPYNPRNRLFGMTAYYLTNPYVSLVVPLVIGVIISHFYYRRSLTPKCLCLDIEEDRLVVNTDKNSTPLLFDSDKNPVRCASVCTVRITREGSGHISDQDILTRPLQLRFHPVKKIVSFQSSEGSTDSWNPPIQSTSDVASLDLAFSNLERGDYIKISALCEQDEQADITPSIEGRIKDVTKYTKRRNINTDVFRIKNIVLLMLFLILSTAISVLIYYVIDLLVMDDLYVKLGVYATCCFVLLVTAIAIVTGAWWRGSSRRLLLKLRLLSWR